MNLLEWREFELPCGWYNLFTQMADDLIATGLDKEFEFTQVKEKYGSMCAYHNGCLNQEQENIISKYEHISRYICAECGKPATICTTNWIMPYCDDCCRSARITPIHRNLMLTVTKCVGESAFTVILDCTDIWERYERSL